MPKYDDLYKAYQCLLTENNILKVENERLHKRLNLKSTLINATENSVRNTIPQLPLKNKIQITLEEKIKLFRSLFCRREDVFAKRWYSPKTEKSGYQPVCGNEWDKIFYHQTVTLR